MDREMATENLHDIRNIVHARNTNEDAFQLPSRRAAKKVFEK